MNGQLPLALREVLPSDTARTWVLLRDHLPDSLVLYGGTALAAHLGHRVSRDLDFFYSGPLDLTALRRKLESIGKLAVSTEHADSLNAVFNSTRVQFLRTRGQQALESPTVLAGIKVAGVRDIAATKLKVVADRGELRDYFDLMVIEQRTAVTVESALLDFQERYHTHDSNTLVHIIRALGTFSDVNDDPGLPVARDIIEGYWGRRARSLTLTIDSSGTTSIRPTAAALAPRTGEGSLAESPGSDDGVVWVEPHERGGRLVRGYWRRR